MTTYRVVDVYGNTLLPIDGGPARTLNGAVDWDIPFEVATDGTATIVDTDVTAPPVPDVRDYPEARERDRSAVDVHIDHDWWTALTGHTGQYGYHGAQMHPSETLSGGLARAILSDPGVYAITEVRDEDGSFPEEPNGWCILRLITKEVQ